MSGSAESSSPAARPLLPLIPGIVYGPVHSRRLGTSLGLNILPPDSKVCTFNCVYCQYGWTERRSAVTGWPSPPDVAAALTRAVTEIGNAVTLQRLTLAGHGEPTLHPAFGAVVDAILDVRARLVPGASVAVLTNGTRLEDPAVRAGLARLDERYVKLDAGSPAMLRRVNGSADAFDRLVASMRAVPDITLQSLFVVDPAGRCGNGQPGDHEAWLACVRSIAPRAVHLYTLDRMPALGRLRPTDPLVLHALADALRHAGIEARVFG